MLTHPALPNHTLDSRFCIVFFCSVRVGFFVDSQSLANDLHLRHALKCGKINRTQCHLLKRCRGGGFLRGRERPRNLSPSPLKKKTTTFYFLHPNLCIHIQKRTDSKISYDFVSNFKNKSHFNIQKLKYKLITIIILIDSI